jgi:hypothetical protein
MHFPTNPRALGAAAVLMHLALAVPTEDTGINASVLVPRHPQASNTGPFQWAVIGDSWSSGIAYNYWNQYDKVTDCRRTTEAWGALMAADFTWAPTQQFDFAACAGSKFESLTTDQVPNTGSPGLVISTIGGNNAFFGDTVDNCIYHGDPFKDYGLPYHLDTNGTGDCWKSLQAASSYIDNGLGFDLNRTLDDLFAAYQAKSQSPFYLYLSSYAHFFNADSDICNTWSFAPWWASTPLPRLVKELRQEFNNRTDAFHAVYVSALPRTAQLNLI